MRVALMLVLLMVTLVIVAVGRGSIGNGANASAANVRFHAGGFGEVYAAKTATLKKALFNAKLLPSNKAARNIALAGLGRADKAVNQNLALKCWKNNGCSTGTGGKLTVAYVEGFGENVFRQISKMEFILQALTYKSIGKIIYSSAHSDPAQALTDFRAAISQHVNVIVTYPDFGDAMLPVFREATKAGIPVATYAWGYVTGPGSNYLTVVGEDTCRLGKAYAKVMNQDVKSGDIAFLGGFPGNPLSLGWQKCERPALNKNIHVVATEATNWDPSKVQEVVAGILSRYPNIKG
jgi:ABC-type sugar transport system substrate-binding protein